MSDNPPPVSDQPVLKLLNVESAYGPIKAIRGVSLQVRRGEPPWPGATIRSPNGGSVLWGCVVSTGLGCQGTRAEVPSGLVKPAAKRSNCQQAACSRPRRLGGKVSVEAASPSWAVEASLSEGAIRMSAT